LIIQNDTGNEYAGTTIVASITTSTGKAYPFMVKLAQGTGGLNYASAVDLAQIMTIDKSRLGKRLGRLTPAETAVVDAALKKSLAL
jgi:mRNA interferase MazF